MSRKFDALPPRRGRDDAALWRLVAHWWAVGAALLVAVAGMGFALAVWGSVDAAPGRAVYPLRELLKDGADVALKLGAVVAGLIGMYRYWYQRYEPLVYFTTCGLIRRSVLDEIKARNSRFRSPVTARLERRVEHEDREALRWHRLPIVVLHRHDMHVLGISDGAQVDLEFETPTGRRVWAVAFAFTFPLPDTDSWPVGLSLSLRELFQMEKPFPGVDGGLGSVPAGWQVVEVNASDLYTLSTPVEARNSLLWLARSDYTVRFIDTEKEYSFAAEDNLEPGRGRVLEYVGIALRVYRRSALRYRS